MNSMSARIKSDTELLRKHGLEDSNLVGRVGTVERRNFKDGELKSYDLSFSIGSSLGYESRRIGITVPAELVEVV